MSSLRDTVRVGVCRGWDSRGRLRRLLLDTARLTGFHARSVIRRR
jgi:hypothetical protein